MATILCKKCGGTIEVSWEQDSCECPYCGTIYNLVRNKNAGKSAKKPRSRAEILLKKYINAVEECDIERASELSDKLTMEDIPSTLYPEIYSLATEYMENGKKSTAIDLFSLLPDNYRDAQLLMLEYAIEKGNHYAIEHYFQRVTSPEFRERKCKMLLSLARKEETKPNNFAWHYYRLLADCGNAEARAWMAEKQAKIKKEKRPSNFWWLMTFIAAIPFWISAFFAGTQVAAKEEISEICLLGCAGIFVIVSFIFPIYKVVRWAQGEISRYECNSRINLTIFFDLFAAIIAYIAFRLGA